MDADTWATRTLRELVPLETALPVYGTPAWEALPEDSPLRLAAAIAAAEARRGEREALARAVAAGLDTERHTRAAALADLLGPAALALIR